MTVNVSPETQKSLTDLEKSNCLEETIVGTLPVPANLASKELFPGTRVGGYWYQGLQQKEP